MPTFLVNGITVSAELMTTTSHGCIRRLHATPPTLRPHHLSWPAKSFPSVTARETCLVRLWDSATSALGPIAGRDVSTQSVRWVPVFARQDALHWRSEAVLSL